MAAVCVMDFGRLGDDLLLDAELAKGRLRELRKTKPLPGGALVESAVGFGLVAASVWTLSHGRALARRYLARPS